MKRLGEEDRIAYGKSLLQVVSRAALPGRLMLTATTMAETKKQLKERVEYIVKKQKLSVVATICMCWCVSFLPVV
jgi:beta-lactamase regulating signal transducer with metallopeptidase domain